MHRVARAFGQPLQYSVFVCLLDRTNRVRLAAAIQEVIEKVHDRVVIIDLGADRDESWIPDFETFGRQQVERRRGAVIA